MRGDFIFGIWILFAISEYGTVPVDKNGKMFDKNMFSGNGETPLYWRVQAKEELNKYLSLQNTLGVARNVILFLGDGMGISTITAARILQGQLKHNTGEEEVLSWEKFNHVALSKTYNQDHQTPDSAGTGTAYLCGVKTNMGMLGVDGRVKKGVCSSMQGSEVTSIADWSLAKGKSVGFVTTTRVTHATPAASYAHTPHRDWEGDSMMEDVDGKCKDIATQLIDDNRDFKVIMGGGREFFIPLDERDPERGNNSVYGRRDGRNLINEWIQDKQKRELKHSYVWNLTDFKNIDPENTDYILGLFEQSHMQYEVDRENETIEAAGEPSISEMTEKAIQVLQKNKKGYFLLVEGGRIDHAHHESNAYRSLHDTIAFADAVQKAADITSANETLIVVTADHSHTFTLGGYPSRGNPILGLTDNNGDGLLAKDNKTYSTLMYANGPGHTDVRQNLTLETAESKDYLQQSTIPLDYETHGGEDVAIYARGPMSHLFQGVHEENYIAHVMAYASCVGDYSNDDDCAAVFVRRTGPPPLNTNNNSNAAFRTELSKFVVILSLLLSILMV